MKLLYCSVKMLYKSDKQYFSNGSFPEFIPALSMKFEKMYLMVPVKSVLIKGISQLLLNEHLTIIETHILDNRLFQYSQRLFWSLIFIKKFLKYQKHADAVLIAIPSSINYLFFLPFINKPLIILVAGDEQEWLNSSDSFFLKLQSRIGINYFKQIMERVFLNRSDLIICRNNRFKVKIQNHYLIEKEKINVVTSGVNTNLFKSLPLEEKNKIRQDFGIFPNDFVIGFVAQQISHEKGGDNLIQIFLELQKEHENLKLLLIGEDTIGIPSNDSIKKCGLVEKEKLFKYYNLMDVFIFLSRSEGAPKVLMEAMSCGIPIIASNVGGIPEMIQNEKNGFLVSLDDNELVKKYCNSMMNEPENRLEMSKYARKFASENYDFYKLITKISNLINTIPTKNEIADEIKRNDMKRIEESKGKNF